MKAYFYYFILYIVLLFSNIAKSQVPEDFQFIDHDWVETTAMNMVVLDEGIFYSSPRGIHKASYNYQLERKGNDNYGRSRLITLSDSSFILLQWDIWHQDFSIPGFVFLNKSVDLEEYKHVEEPISDILDITYDSLGGWWCLSGNLILENIHHIDSSGIINSIDVEFSESLYFHDKIFTNAEGNIFIYSNFNFSGSSLYQVKEQEVIPIDFIQANRIKGISLWKGNNLVLTNDQILLTNPAFDSLLYSWHIFENLNDLNDIQINNDSSFYSISISENDYELTKRSKTSELIFSFNGIIGQDETLTGIKVLSDTTHVVYGQRKLELANNLFFRNINTSKTIVYPSADIGISNFTIKKDSNSTPTTFIGTIELELSNNGSQSIYKSTAYTNFYEPYNFDLGTQIISTISINNFDSQEERLYQEEIKVSALNDIDTFAMAIPGANYKFNINNNAYRPIDFILATAGNNNHSLIDIYPNPANNFATIPTGASQLLIYDSSSKFISKKRNLNPETTEVDITNLVGGLYYFVLIDKDDKVQVGEVIKME